jgi:hypothetical protein
MLTGSAEIETVGAGGGATVIVTLLVAVPPAPVAVMVYEVVIVGDTLIDPLGPTAPIPGWISHESALVDCHVKVADPPYGMLRGSAAMATVGAGAETVTVTLLVAVPPGPVAVMVYLVVAVGDTIVEPLGLTAPTP